MKKLIIIPILFIAVLLSGCANNKIVSFNLDPSDLLGNELQSSKPAFSPFSDSQDGVDVTVKNIKKENGQTIIELTLSNHRYDLAAMDVQRFSNLAGIQPSGYKIISSAMGGHHVEAEMIFDQELFGSLTIGLDDLLVFNFNIQ